MRRPGKGMGTMRMSIVMTSMAITGTTTAIPMLMIPSKPPALPAQSPGHLDAAEAAALYRLMTWLSPAFPIGAFSYSSGIEWAVEAGDITDAAMLRDWLSAMLEGPGFCDGVFLAHAHRAGVASDQAVLRDV